MYKTIMDYVREEMEPITIDNFCEVDSLILSWLSYYNFPEDPGQGFPAEGYPLREAYRAECFPAMFAGVKAPEKSRELLSLCAASPRFRDLRLLSYVHHLDSAAGCQFAAVTFRLAPELSYLAFRGTDSTLTGWKEDFCLSLQEPVPAQTRALAYAEEICGKQNGILILGGHSKGGNLAVFAAAELARPDQDRILAVYSHDGPGFLSGDLTAEGFRQIRTRIRKTIPQSSLFGLIFEQETETDIVYSHDISVLQHFPFGWEVDGHRFVRREHLTPDAVLLEKTLDGWLARLSQKDRERFIDGIFRIIESSGAETFDELGDNLKEQLPVMVQSFTALEPDMRRFLLHTVSLLWIRRQDREEKDRSLAEQIRQLRTRILSELPAAEKNR